MQSMAALNMSGDLASIPPTLGLSGSYGSLYTSRPQYAASISTSPSSPTPSLSPSSTETSSSSSEGERTIQMSGFVGESFASSGTFILQVENRGFTKPFSGSVNAYPGGGYQYDAPIAQERHAPAYPAAPFGAISAYTSVVHLEGGLGSYTE